MFAKNAMGSIAASSLAIYRYEDANDAAVRIAGAGAPDWAIAAMAGLVLVGFLALRFPSDDFLARRRRRKHPQPAWT